MKTIKYKCNTFIINIQVEVVSIVTIVYKIYLGK